MVDDDNNRNMQISVTNYPYKSWGEYYPGYVVNLKNLPVHKSWESFLEREMAKEYFSKTEKFLSHALKVSDGKVKIYPYPELVFNAFLMTPLDDVKVVILGQDPYPKNETYDDKMIPQAMGLSFSVPTGMDIPSSLSNIYNNLVFFKHLSKKPTTGELTSWAKQGCLMLNTALTVQHGYPNSHAKYWTEFTNAIISHISKTLNNVTFVLWGGPALSKLELIDLKKHNTIISSHPSGLSCSKPLRTYPAFNENDHFGKINEYLKKHKKGQINWDPAYKEGKTYKLA